MHKQNDDMELIKRLHNMPYHSMNPAAKSRLFKGIRDYVNRFEKSYKRNTIIKRLAAGSVCCAALLLVSISAFTPTGREYTGKLWAGITSSDKITPSIPGAGVNEALTPTPDINNGPSVFLDANVSSIDMIDEKSGWAAGDKKILHTDDGGITWIDVTPSDTQGRITGSYFLDAMNGWTSSPVNGSGQLGLFNIYRTSDGGRSWEKAVSPVEGVYTVIRFTNERQGFILVPQGAAAGSEEVTLLKSEDGGATWAVVSKTDSTGTAPGGIPFGGQKYGAVFRNSSNGYIAGFSPADGHAYFYVTNDGGVTWQDANLSVPPEFTKDTQLTLYPPVFFGDQDGVMAASPGSEDRSIFFYATHDGGKTWSYTPCLTPADKRDLKWSFIDAYNAAASDGKNIYKTSDGGNTWETITPNVSMDEITALDFVSKDNGYIISGGLLYGTKDGGRTWELTSAGK